MALPIGERSRVGVDCDCGVTLEACDIDELLDDVLEHIAVAHDDIGRDPETLVAAAFDA